MSTGHTYEEKELLLRIAQGDESSFAILFNTYYRPLLSYVLRFTESLQVSEEIVQDVFLKIWMARESMAAVENCKAYLITVAKNQTMNALKKIAREKAKAKQLQEEAASPDGEADNSRYGMIDRAIDQLPPQQKKVYLLARHSRLSYEEIGRQLELSPKTVKKHMQLAIAAVTAFLKASVKLLLALILCLKIFF